VRRLAAHRRPAALALGLVLVPALAATGCGGNQKQDRDEPEGTVPIFLESTSFPATQSLAKTSILEIVVRNAGSKTIPNINVTVHCRRGAGGSFDTVSSDVNAAERVRPQFIVNTIPTPTEPTRPPLDPAPLERSTQFVDTYPLGGLAPGLRATFQWNLTAVKAGPYRICWRVKAGLFGKAKAQASPDSEPIAGEFRGVVTNEAPAARVGDDDRTVIPSEGPPRGKGERPPKSVTHPGPP